MQTMQTMMVLEKEHNVERRETCSHKLSKPAKS